LISPRLVNLVRCPDCHGWLRGDVAQLQCESCGRRFTEATRDYLVLRTASAYDEMTKFAEKGFHADGRDESVAPPLLSAAVRNNMLRAFLNPGPEDVVVDLGCGSGRFAIWNLDCGAHFVGIDTVTFFAAESRANVDLVVGELRKLPFADGGITKAYAIDVVEHLSTESLDAMLREIHRTLAPGGSLFIYTHVMQLSPFAPVLAGIASVSRAIERIGLADLTVDRLRPTDHLNPLASRAHLDEVAARAGFRVARFRYYTPIFSRIAESIIVPLAAHALARRKSTASAVDSDALRVARLSAKQTLAKRGIMYRALQVMTWFVMLDVRLLGRIRSGPFFALLVKGDQPVAVEFQTTEHSEKHRED
jgi:SAM-dependent methyltransferase